jgi:hypothetical protein
VGVNEGREWGVGVNEWVCMRVVSGGVGVNGLLPHTLAMPVPDFEALMSVMDLMGSGCG